MTDETEADLRRELRTQAETIRALAAQGGATAAELAALRRDADRTLARLDAEPSLEVLRYQMDRPTAPAPDADTWHDNAERGFGRLMASSPGRILAAAVFAVALGAVVVLGILAWKGDLDEVVAGAFTPGAEVEAVRRPPSPE